MLKLALSFCFSLGISALLFWQNLQNLLAFRRLLSELPLQDCSGQVLGWYDACINTNTFRQLSLDSFSTQAYLSFYMLICACIFALAFLLLAMISAYVHSAYEAYHGL